MAGPTEKTECHAIKWLVENEGRIGAAEILSVHPTSIGAWLKSGYAPTMAEKLAVHIRQERQDKKGTTLMMVKVPHDKRELLITFLKGAQIKFMQFEDK